MGLCRPIFQNVVSNYLYTTKFTLHNTQYPHFSRVNWYIKKPDFQGQSNYYIKPFHYKIWASILIILLTGTIFDIILHYGNKNQTHEYNLLDSLFMTFDNLCNQGQFYFQKSISLLEFFSNSKIFFSDGSQNKRGFPLKMIIRALRGRLKAFVAVEGPLWPLRAFLGLKAFCGR